MGILERCLKLKATKVLLLLLFYSVLQLYLQVKPSCSSEQDYEYSGRCCTKCEPGNMLTFFSHLTQNWFVSKRIISLFFLKKIWYLIKERVNCILTTLFMWLKSRTVQTFWGWNPHLGFKCQPVEQKFKEWITGSPNLASCSITTVWNYHGLQKQLHMTCPWSYDSYTQANIYT